MYTLPNKHQLYPRRLGHRGPILSRLFVVLSSVHSNYSPPALVLLYPMLQYRNICQMLVSSSTVSVACKYPFKSYLEARQLSVTLQINQYSSKPRNFTKCCGGGSATLERNVKGARKQGVRGNYPWIGSHHTRCPPRS